jgi:hypothetical protein
MTELKAIETEYNGHLFRSRLEARWAMFFDEIGIVYQYELEGYELEGGGRYLPDFYLPDFKVYVEVKPNQDLPPDQVEKLVKFAADGDQPLLLIIGTPLHENMFLLDRRCLPSWGEFSGSEVTPAEALMESVMDWAQVEFGVRPNVRGWHINYRVTPPHEQHSLSEAKTKAAQARFETPRFRQ